MTPLFDPDRYVAACRFAAEAHHGQRWPGTELPYLLHLQLVTQEVIAALTVERTERPEDAVLCALLHDSVEDTGVTLDDIAARFGDTVAAGVAALTKDARLPKAERMPDSLRRIRAQPREVWIVKLADRITNLGPPPPHWSAEKCAAYRHQAQEIHDALVDAHGWLAARLTKRITGYPARMSR